MEFVFLSAHKVLGIVKKAGEPDLVLFEGPDPKMTVWITSDMDTHWRVLDRHVALASMMLRGMVGQPLPGEFQENLEQQIETVRRRRSESLGPDGIVIIEIRGNLEVALNESSREIDDYILCFDAFDKRELRTKLQSPVSSVLAALRIGGSGEYGFEHIGDGSYAITNHGKIVHSFSAEFGAPRLYVASPLKDGQAARVKRDIGLILGSGDLARVVRLHAQSLDRATDNFRAFVSAWSALEILIGKIFPMYQKKLASEMENISAAPGLTAYLQRIADVMSDKHNLADKFAVISMYLDDEQNVAEIERFRELKRIRDLLSHGEEVPDGSLPTKEVQRLFEKYFRNHVRSNA